MDDDQQFCLRWNNHQSTLISVFDTLLENETLVDCTLAAEGKFLKAHKVVLSACSPYFATLLQEQYDKHPIFILKDVKYQELRAMMDYMYRGEVNISQDQLAALLKAAESLQIKGLSDNRSGAPKPEHHRGMSVPGSSGKLGAGYTLEQTQSKRARIGPSSMETQDMGSREGSSSPSRRRRKVRRRSIENVMADVHDNSNSSQMQTNQSSLLQQQQQQSNASLAGVGAITAAASALASQMPVPVSTLATGSSGAVAGAIASTQGTATSVTKKTESVKGTSDAMNTENVQAGGADDSGMEHMKGDKQNHKQKSSVSAAGGVGKEQAELVIEPKSEYDEEGNDETVEDLTLDDEEMGMEDLDQNAGTSQGGEGSSQGYAPWQHERSQDELLLATQEAQQRDPQVEMKYVPTKKPKQRRMLAGASPLIPGERFHCRVCKKSYLRKRHLQRHMRDECIGIPPRFRCELCPSSFRRKYHMVRHLISKHGLPAEVAQKVSGGGNRKTGGGAGGGNRSNVSGNWSNASASGADAASVSSGCESPYPENLSMRRELYVKTENLSSPVINGGGGGTPVGAGASNALNVVVPAAAAAGGSGGGGDVKASLSPIPAGMLQMPTYGLTGAITAISAAAAVVEEHANQLAANNASTSMAAAAAAAASGSALNPNTDPNRNNMVMDEDWKMKLSLQLISNSLLKERFINSMPFAYNSNN